MKIHLLSDIHLEFGQYNHEFPQADVCILAGDIMTPHAYKPEGYSQRHRQVATDFFTRVSKAFPLVLYIPGNHEYYSSTLQLCNNEIQDFLKQWPNIYWHHNRGAMLNGYHFFGCTLWTDFNRSDPIAMTAALHGMNDFRLIRYLEENGTVVMRPDHTVYEHRQSLRYMLTAHARLSIIFTHHAPSFQSVDYRYEDSNLNPAYASDLTGIIHLIQPKLWLHGHMHASNDYTIGTTRIVSNPRGYVNRDENPNFNPNLILEI